MRANLESGVYLIGDQSPQASPQETKSRLWLFLIMIYDLVVKNARLWNMKTIPLSQSETFSIRRGNLATPNLLQIE